MIPYDEEWRFNPDCSTCKHRQPRVRSKRSGADKPRTKNWVCMVEGCAIGEHGTWMHCVEGSDGKPFGGTEKWVQDIPCKCNLRDGKGWFALDYKPADTHHHEPTVEDVLLEACNAYHSLLIEGMSDVAHDMPAPSEIIAEYSAKLRLANDGEEQ